MRPGTCVVGGTVGAPRGRRGLVCCAALALAAACALGAPALGQEAPAAEPTPAAELPAEPPTAPAEGAGADAPADVPADADVPAGTDGEGPAEAPEAPDGVAPDGEATSAGGDAAPSDDPAAPGGAAASAAGETAVPAASAGASAAPDAAVAPDAASTPDPAATDVPEAASEAGGYSSSWRYQDGVPTHPANEGELDGVATYAGFTPWQRVGSGYVNAAGNLIPGAVRRGVDVSSWDDVNWEQAAADDVDFAVLRIGYGAGHYGNAQMQPDANFEYNASECERLGIPYGVYFYSMATTPDEARAEARYVLSLLGSHRPSMPVYFDVEDGSILDAQAHVTNVTKAFCQVIAAAGYTPGVYANLWWWNTYIDDSVCEPSARWVAQYADACTYDGSYGMWQCTSTGSVAGVGQNRCDIDFVMDPAASQNGTVYSDIPADAWYASGDYLAYVTRTGVMTGERDADGLPTGRFLPDERMTRGQVATVLYRATHPDATDTTDPSQYARSTSFADASVPAYYNAAINWCEQAGVITGYEDARGRRTGYFGPNDPITREQLATMLARFASSQGAGASQAGAGALGAFPDAGSVSSFARDGLGWCVANAVVTGVEHAGGSPTLEPLAFATRAEAAKMLCVMLRDVL